MVNTIPKLIKSMYVGRKNSVIAGAFFLAWVLVLLLSVSVFAETDPASTFLAATVNLESGTVDLSYDSEAGKLEIDFTAGDRKQEATISSGDRLGVLILVAGEDLSYEVSFLDDGEKWNPDEISGKRMTLSQHPGWEIVLVEQSEGFVRVNDCRGGRR